MRRHLQIAWVLLTSVSLVIGCAPTKPVYLFDDGDLSHYIGLATNIETPDLDESCLEEIEQAMAPLTLANRKFDEPWDLSLEQAVRHALENGKIMRNLGGAFLASGGQRPQVARAPDVLQTNLQGVPTVYDPAITETNPTFGVEGALSAFDAQVTSSLIYNKTDRPQNQVVTGAPVREQDLGQFQAGISKRTAAGGRFSLNNQITYDRNNAPFRPEESDWFTAFEAGFNQPLLQGAGTQFNRIAGPFDPFTGTGTPNFDGVVLARINTDIALADFEAGVRNMISDVENAYWELYYAYRFLDARKKGLASARETWRKVNTLRIGNVIGGEADKEAQAREQFYFFRADVETALSDLYKAENRLRYLMGISSSDGRLIRPATEPTSARMALDWSTIQAEGLVRSVELRQQKWRIKQRELELIAAKNLLLPRLDLQGRYRWLGLGDDLLDPDGGRGFTAASGLDGTDAFTTLTDGGFQESEIGLNFTMNLGFRRELITIRNQQLLLTRERARLQDQELELQHQLADAVRDLDTHYQLMRTNVNRWIAAEEQVRAVKAIVEAGKATLDLLLDAQRRQAEDESLYYRSLVDYNRGIAQLHFRKGSLLEYNGVLLAEGPWPGKAYFDAERLAHQRDASWYLDYGFTRPSVFSQGPYQQHAGEHAEMTDDAVTDEAAAEEIPTPAATESPTPASPGTTSPAEPEILRDPTTDGDHDSESDGPRLGRAAPANAESPANDRDGEVVAASASEPSTTGGLKWKSASGVKPATHETPVDSKTSTGWKKTASRK